MNVAHAFVRFGLGRRGGEPLPADPGIWARAQLSGPDPLRLADPPTSAAGLAALREDREKRPPPAEQRGRAIFRQDAAVQLGNALATPTPFRERLVWFWTNHFMVSLHRPVCAAVAGAFVEEAIRPHVTGHFADMLLAVMHHPRDAAVPRQRLLGGAEQPGGQEWQAGAERESGAGMPRTAHREPRRRINPGGRDELRARADRLVDRPARLPVPPVRARAGGADRHGPALSAWRGRRRGSAAVSGAPSRDASLSGRQIMGPALSSSSWEVRCPADAWWRSGLVWGPASCSRTATCSRRRTCAKGLLALHLCLGAAELAVAFPDSAAAEPMNGLIWTDG
jgi:Protein of unknown function (DUF1800)